MKRANEALLKQWFPEVKYQSSEEGVEYWDVVMPKGGNAEVQITATDWYYKKEGSEDWIPFA